VLKYPPRQMIFQIEIPTSPANMYKENDRQKIKQGMVATKHTLTSMNLEEGASYGPSANNEG
jgi:hypothetical protein